MTKKQTMKAVVFRGAQQPLELQELPLPTPGQDELLLRVLACGVCRTDLHILRGELPSPKLPLILGHQIVGTIQKLGNPNLPFKEGQRVGVPWLGETCGHCSFCLEKRENLCNDAKFTGYQINGGFAEYTTAKAEALLPLPKSYSDTHVAPLLCAGLIGFRALRMAGNVSRIGFYGFGASAHILTQIVTRRGGSVYAFTKPNDHKGMEFAKSLGAVWAGGSDDSPPEKLDAAILFAPDGALIPKALRDVERGGRVISAGIYMSDIPSFPYSILWEERSIHSVANLTHLDGIEFFKAIESIPIETHVHSYPLERTEEALLDLEKGAFEGALVIEMERSRA